jgi:hypothetical protein
MIRVSFVRQKSRLPACQCTLISVIPISSEGFGEKPPSPARVNREQSEQRADLPCYLVKTNEHYPALSSACPRTVRIAI